MGWKLGKALKVKNGHVKTGRRKHLKLLVSFLLSSGCPMCWTCWESSNRQLVPPTRPEMTAAPLDSICRVLSGAVWLISLFHFIVSLFSILNHLICITWCFFVFPVKSMDLWCLDWWSGHSLTPDIDSPWCRMITSTILISSSGCDRDNRVDFGIPSLLRHPTEGLWAHTCQLCP